MEVSFHGFARSFRMTRASTYRISPNPYNSRCSGEFNYKFLLF